MSKVLILGCGTQALIMVKDLKEVGHQVYLIGEKNNYADASRFVDIFIQSVYSPSSEDYLKLVLNTVITYAIETIIPMGDVSSEFLSVNKKQLQKYVKYQLPDIDVWRNAVNKSSLMSVCKYKGYPIPFTINSEEELMATKKADIPFPLLIKPNITCGARGMTLVNSYEELMDRYPAIKEEYGDCHFQQYVKQGGAQVEVQLYIDENKHLVNSSVIYKYRWYPEKGGSSCCAVSVKNDRIVDILYHLLIDLNWVGFADFDTIENPETGELLIMELNPRVPACVKCAIVSGVHWGQIIADGYLGLPQKQYDYHTGEYLRHLGFEVLWFLKSPNRFKTKPCWFNFFGRHIHYQDMSGWDDLKPFFTGTIRNVKKVMGHKEKEKIKR